MKCNFEVKKCGKIGEIKRLNIEVRKDGRTVYEGVGANVPEEYKIEFKQVKINHEKVIYTI